MRSLRRRCFWRSLRHRLSAGLTLVAYLLTAFGVPVPARATAAAACGCVSDDYCNSGGCCCSNKGKSPSHRRAVSCCTNRPGCTMPCCRHDKPSASCPHEDQSPSDSQDDAPADGVRWVPGMSALKCRGHSTQWVSGGVVLPAPLPIVVLASAAPIGQVVYADEAAAVVDHIPPIPPPRAA